MMRFLKTLFGSASQQGNARRLIHPEDLRTGDIIKFGYLPQADISNTQFEVSQVNTYIYGDLCYPELVLKDSANHLVYMMVEEEDGEEFLGISKKIPKSLVDEIFDSADITRVIGRGTGTVVNTREIPQEFTNWIVKHYKECDDNVKGSFVKGDARYLSDEAMTRQERFSSHILVDDTDEYAVEIEIYETNEMEISVTVYHDINQISEMWPAAGEK